MQLKKLLKFKKNFKLIRLNKLYFDLLKTKHLLTFFIGGLKQHQLIKLYKVTSSRQSFLSFLKKLECRLEFILLKSGFVLTGKQAKQLILHGHILVNALKVKAYNYKVKLYDLVSVDKSFISNYKEQLICNLFRTFFFSLFLKKKRVLKKGSIMQLFAHFKFPSFFEVNYKTVTLCLVREPLFSEFFFPKFLSLYDCNQLYFIL
jgi:ribosomal protein S4